MSEQCTPDQALTHLLRGNERFVAGRPDHPHQSAQRRREISDAGQQPYAIILSCADSRVPPEIIFDQGLGDVFVIRVAGNVLDDVILGTIEYAVEHMHTPLVMVLGHDKCGAVTAAVEQVKTNSHVQAVVDALQPALLMTAGWEGDRVSAAIDANVRYAVKKLQASEPVLMGASAVGQLRIVWARYHLDSGEVKLIACE